MPNNVLIESFLSIIERFRLADIEIAALAGISPHTVRLCRVGRTMPTQARCQAAIEGFVARSKDARSRADLQLCGGNDGGPMAQDPSPTRQRRAAQPNR
jgi:hypothetical protein